MRRLVHIFLILPLIFLFIPAAHSSEPTLAEIQELKLLANARKMKYQVYRDLLCHNTWNDRYWRDYLNSFMKDTSRIQIDHILKGNAKKYLDQDNRSQYEDIIISADNRTHGIAWLNALAGNEWGQVALEVGESVFTEALAYVIKSATGSESNLGEAVLMVKTAFHLRECSNHIFYAEVDNLFNWFFVQQSVVKCYLDIYVDDGLACSGSPDGLLCEKAVLFLRNNYFENIINTIDVEINIYDLILGGSTTFEDQKSALYNVYNQQRNILGLNDSEGILEVKNGNTPFYQYFWNEVATNIEPQLSENTKLSQDTKAAVLERIQAIGFIGTLFFKMDRAFLTELMYVYDPTPFSSYDNNPTNGFIDMAELIKILDDWKVDIIDMTALLDYINRWRDNTRAPLD
jgi:hypothetical protein